MTNVPSTGLRNIEAYSDIFKLEVGLREFISDCFSKHFGLNWLEDPKGPASKINLVCPPRDIKNGQKAYRDLKGKVDYLRHLELEKGWNDELVSVISGLYFLLWTDLVTCIEQNWFEKVGISSSEIFHLKSASITSLCNSIKSLNTIRNKVAHNMLITEKDWEILRHQNYIIYSYVNIEEYYLKACQIEELLPSVELCVLNAYEAILNDLDVDNILLELHQYREKIREINYFNIIEVTAIVEDYKKYRKLAGQYEKTNICKIEISKIISNAKKPI